MLSVALNHPICTLECTKSAPKQALRVREISAISEQMKLSESHSSLSPLCRTLEVRLANVEQLANLDLPVCLLPDFESFPEANFSAAFRSTPAAYQIHEPKILVNGDRFLSLPFHIQQAAIAHEIAHAICQRTPLQLVDPDWGIRLSEEIVADFLVCSWGLLDELTEERSGSYGARYCEILRMWPQQADFVRQMTVWYQQKLSGQA
jgi:hypothetical protein